MRPNRYYKTTCQLAVDRDAWVVITLERVSRLCCWNYANLPPRHHRAADKERIRRRNLAEAEHKNIEAIEEKLAKVSPGSADK
jgi:hypothetical protein